MKNKLKIQEAQYIRPYHHYVSFDKYNLKIYEHLSWGLEYYSYTSFVIDYLKNLKYDRLAEVGCGDGKIILELAKKNPLKKFEGYDISKKSILFANAYSNNQKNLRFFNKNFSKSKSRYDVILLIEVLEHIHTQNLQPLLKIISKNLEKDGVLIVSVPTKNIKIHPKHYRHYDYNLLKKQVGKFFNVKKHVFIYNGKSKVVKLINIFLSNRAFILTNKLMIKLLKKIHDKYYKQTTKEKGSHLVAFLNKK